MVATVLLGCTEKKEESKGAKGAPETMTCDLIDKMPGDAAKTLEINYGNKVKLVGIRSEKLLPGQITMFYYWQLLDDLGKTDTVFVHFMDADNKSLSFQGDHPLCRNRTFAELKGKIIKETQLITIPQPALGKEVKLKIGVYAPTVQNERLKIELATGGTKSDDNTAAIVETIHLQ
jgi:hypothetical protein